MWSEDINKKIRDAGDGDNFPFDDKSWEKMEVLLDKHLPQKKKRRGLFLLLLSVCLLSIPAVMLLKEKGIKKTNIYAAQTKKNNTSSNGGAETGGESNTIAQKEMATAPVSDDANSIIAGTILDKTTTPGNTGALDKNMKVTETKELSKANLPPRASNSFEKASKISEASKQIKSSSEETLSTPLNEKSGTNYTNEKISSKALLTFGNPDDLQKNPVSPEKKTPTTIDSVAVAKKENKKKNTSSAPRRKFSINFSIGPDVSGAMHGSIGRVETKYGLGLRYELSKKIAIRTGFFVSRKIYSADSAAYHPDPSFWTYYPNLQKVDANCLVYEIPVNISYTLFAKKKNSAFVSTGLSSYLMKKETYNYSYKNAWGGPEKHTSVYNSENKHFFSVLNLSAGLSHQFSDRLSLIVEPYAQLPVKGVGAGKVKLNSAGILFTIDYKPFGKK